MTFVAPAVVSVSNATTWLTVAITTTAPAVQIVLLVCSFRLFSTDHICHPLTVDDDNFVQLRRRQIRRSADAPMHEHVCMHVRLFASITHMPMAMVAGMS